MTDFIYENLPKWGEKRIAMHVRPTIEATVHQGHPWLFDQAITKQSHDGNAGDLAVLYNRHNKFLAVGLYDPFSPIRVKILQANQPAQINQAWFTDKLRQALARRESLINSATNGYRLVHGENDGLPALIIDRYADTLVIKLYTVAWIPHLRDLLPAIEAVFPAERWVLRLSRVASDLPEWCYGLYDGQILKGEPLTAPIVFQENGLLFQADVVHGHKTGFFFDQRDNRQWVGDHAYGRTVLDIFAYVGAFSLYAAKGGARSILSVDISLPAMEAMHANFALNTPHMPLPKPETWAVDAFFALEQLANQGKRYDMVIIDPPSFAKSQSEVRGALTAYADLTELGADVVAENGILVLASCSSRVTADDFFGVIKTTLQRTRHPIRELQRTQHAVDHPIGFPEGAYLKAWFGQHT